MNIVKTFLLERAQWAYQFITRSFYTFVVAEELPTTLMKRAIYILYEGEYLWHASLLCPCGCGVLIHLNMIPDERPCWRYMQHWNGTVSLSPSVWRTKGCRSHFWIKHGRITWCN